MKSLAIFMLFSSVYARKGFGPTEQEWGYVTVREGAHMFWWLHQTSANVTSYIEKPLIIWLQGGPGSSSTGFGNFGELGPLDEDLNPRNYTWINDFNVLFVDNPVGAGFSYVDAVTYFCTTNAQIADDFVVLLKAFYETVPDLQNTPMYIFTESYGGKMTADIALAIDKTIKAGELNISFEGIALGDSWISPIDSTLTWAPYLLSVGAVDEAGYQEIQKSADSIQTAIENNDYGKATALWIETKALAETLTANIDFYNILTKVQSTWKDQKSVKNQEYIVGDKISDIMNTQVKEALGLTVEFGSQSAQVFDALYEDFMKPVTESVEKILNTTNIKVAIYNGQLDLIVDTPGTIKWLDNLKFNGSQNWASAARKTIPVNEIIEGFYKKLGNLAFYWVNRAGHMVPSDNPAAMKFILFDVITRK